MHFMYVFQPKRDDFLQTMTPDELQAMGAHAMYTNRLHEEGVVIFGGAAMTGAYGIVVFEAESEAAARSIFENDPAVQAGIVRSELVPFQVTMK